MIMLNFIIWIVCFLCVLVAIFEVEKAYRIKSESYKRKLLEECEAFIKHIFLELEENGEIEFCERVRALKFCVIDLRYEFFGYSCEYLYLSPISSRTAKMIEAMAQSYFNETIYSVTCNGKDCKIFIR